MKTIDVFLKAQVISYVDRGSSVTFGLYGKRHTLVKTDIEGLEKILNGDHLRTFQEMKEPSASTAPPAADEKSSLIEKANELVDKMKSLMSDQAPRTPPSILREKETPSAVLPADLCEKCKKRPSEVGVTGTSNGKVTHESYCAACYNKTYKHKYAQRYAP
jgi:hypothetical protein